MQKNLGVNESISSTEPDWSREKLASFWEPGKQVIRSIRIYQKYNQHQSFASKLFKGIAVLQHRFWSVVASCDIPINSQIGGGLLLIHPNGVVIHPKATIGPNCLILQQVTIVEGVEICGHVDIGAGAKIVKAIKIGKHAKIGANAVVTHDIPEHSTAIGIPARVI